MSNPEELSASLEDYLEAIYHLVRENRVARVKGIAKRLGVHKSSVTGALHVLAERDLVNHARYGVVTLTAAGEALARGVVRRHDAMRDFFVDILGVEKSVAEGSACKIEHTVHPDIIERLIRFAEFVADCPRGGSKWLWAFRHHCEDGLSGRNCEACVAACLEELCERDPAGSAEKRKEGDGYDAQ